MNFKEKLIISASNYARLKLNLDENFWVIISDEKHFIDDFHSGLYDKERFLIRYNQKWISLATYEKIIRCAFHEVFHAFQHQEIIKRYLGIKSNVFEEDELDLIEKEFNDSNYNFKKWKSYIVEQQAEEFANLLYSEYFNKFENNNSLFIKMFFDIYINFE